MKRFFWTIWFGAMFGAVLFTWLSPKIIIWYFSPPADLAITCAPAVNWALETYRKVIFIGMLLGILVAMILFFALRASRAKSSAQSVLPDAQK